MGILESVFGKLRWTPPNWFKRLGAKRLGLGVLGVVTLAVLITGGRWYLESLPKPARVVVSIEAPGETPIVGGELRPGPLFLNFSVQADPRYPTDTVDSIASLDLLDEVVTEGIALDPAIPGEWRWASETQLRFSPADDWPAGQVYTVRYDDSLFAPNLILESNEAEFKTIDFRARITELEFYQDPVQQDLRKVVATLDFSHPVDKASLESRVRYTMRESGATIKSPGKQFDLDIRYSPLARQAYVHSTPIEIPPQENYMTLQVGSGVGPIAGPSRLEDDLFQNVRIPDITSYFRVTRVATLTARDENDDLVQTLTIQFTDRVDADRLQDRISAYVLPADAVIENVRREDYRWQSPREVTPAILREAERFDLQLSPVEDDSAALHSAPLDLPEGRHIYLKIDEGLESDGGFVLARPYDTVAHVPYYSKEAKIAQPGAVLPLSSSHRLTFVSRGVQTLRVELGRLIEDDINHLASQTGGDIQNSYFSNYMFNEDNITARSTRFIDLSPEHPGKAAYSSLDLSEYLPDGGFYFINVQGWDKENERPTGDADRRFILITDIGLLVKTNADSSHDVFVHSIATGQPISGANVSLLGKNGIPIVERLSSPGGHVRMPPTNEFGREKTPTVFLVKNGQDAIFMPYARHSRMLQYSRFDVGGEYLQQRPDEQRLRAQLFTDRGIYRPGDAVNIASIVKREDWKALDNIPLALRIIDPRGQVVLDRRLGLPDFGFFDAQFETEAASPTGNYNATLYLVDDGDIHRSIGNTSFKVEEFLPDRLRIRSKIRGQKTKGWIKPDDLVAEVDLENLFGTAAQARRIAGEFTLRPSSINFSEYEGFVFRDPLRNPGSPLQTIEQPLADTTTDENGRAELAIDLSRYDKGIYQLSVLTKGFEEGGGRSVRSRAGVMVSPLDYLVGHKSEGNLGFINRSAENSIEYVAVNGDGDSIELDNLTLSVIEYRYVSALVQRPNGTFAYQSVRKESVVSEQQYAVASGGAEYVLPTDEPGMYAVIIKDDAGLVFSKVDFTVAGARNLAGNLERDAELQLNIDGTSFSAGDEIQIEITAPYTGTGLITIERDRVYAHKWIRSDSNTSLHSIRVPDNLEGNAYVNVAFVRELDSPEIYVSPLSYAVAPFSVNRDARTVDIELDTPQLVRPGDEMTISHRSSRPARIVVYAVDEGILQVARYQLPRPLEYFMPKMALQVLTHQMVDLILPDFDLYRRIAAPGGGEAAGLLGSNLNPFRRKTDAPVVFWSGVIDSGPQAQTVTYRVPDYFNGQLRVMAVAVADDAVGREQSTTVVRAPFIVSPNVLTNAAPGDEFDVNVGVANTLEGSGENAEIILKATHSEHVELIGQNQATLHIDEGGEGRARFRFRVKNKLGPADISFEAGNGEEIARTRATLSVRPPVAYVSTAQSGSSNADPLELSFARSMYNEFARQSVAASASPLVLAEGMFDFLDAFPHACAEQIVSKVFPQIGFLGTQDYEVDEAAVRDLFQSTISKLRSRQGTEGGFRFWATSSEPADFPSIYIVHFFSDASELGLPVPRDMLDSGLGFIRQLAANEVRSLPGARLRAYAIYVLTRNGVVTTNYLTNLHEYLDREFADAWRNDLTASYMAASYMLMQQPQLGNGLVAGYEFGGGDEMTSDFDSRLGRDAQHLYLLARHFPKRMNDVEREDIQRLIDPVMKNRFNTLSSAYTILALGAYTRAVFEETDVQVGISQEVQDATSSIVEPDYFARATVANEIRDVLIDGAEGKNIYYVLSQTGFDATAPQDTLADGLEIQRVFLNDNGDVVTSATIGDELTVRLRIRSTGRPRSNVAVVDLLPGGFEVAADSVDRGYGGWSSDYTDVREDRVVVYGTFHDRVTEIRYRAKLTSAGNFVVPSAFAGSMYDRSVQARSIPGRFEVLAIQ